MVDGSSMNKRRGRKPKGGKIIEVPSKPNDDVIVDVNVILHLGCKKHDLRSDNNDSDVQPYAVEMGEHSLIDKPTECSNQDLWSKVRQLAIELQTNRTPGNKSACFWCTCDFDTPTIYIPKHKLGETYHCYGCFCSPECATAFLFDESIEQSTKFERYALLHHLYGDIYEYDTNICPAPDPHYLLDKFYGNLTIEEYRETFRRKQQLLVIDKPLSRCLPELYEDNCFKTFEIKMRKRDTKTKADIMKENFSGGNK